MENFFISGISFTLRDSLPVSTEDTTSLDGGSIKGSSNSNIASPKGNSGRRWQEIVSFGIKVSKVEEGFLDDSKVGGLLLHP